MRNIFKLLLLIFVTAIFSNSVYGAEKKRIAVMPFDHGGGVTKEEAGYLTEKVRNALINTGFFEVISNDQIENMMKMQEKKQGVGPGSCNTEQCIIDLGNALECEKMLIGKASGAFGEFSVSGKILDVVSQQYEKAQEVTISDKKEFPNAARDMVKKLTEKYADGEENYEEESVESVPAGPATYTGMIWRTAAAPGWGHLYASQNRGWAYIGLWAVSSGLFLFSELNFQKQDKAYHDLGPAESVTEFDAAFAEYESAAQFRMIMSFAFLASYLIPVSDILMTGKSYTGYKTGKEFDINLDISNHLLKGGFNAATILYEKKLNLQFQRSF